MYAHASLQMTSNVVSPHGTQTLSSICPPPDEMIYLESEHAIKSPYSSRSPILVGLDDNG